MSGQTGEFRPLVVNGWTLFAHPIFLDQLDSLTAQVEVLERKDPAGYVKKNAARRLAAIAKLAFEVIPQDPARPEYRQGHTLGDEHKHWFRAKFFQQVRLFFRFHAQAKVIVFAWVNDEDTKRACESADDAYRQVLRLRAEPEEPDHPAHHRQRRSLDGRAGAGRSEAAFPAVGRGHRPARAGARAGRRKA